MLELIRLYREAFENINAQPLNIYKVYTNGWHGDEMEQQNHAMWMLDQMEGMVVDILSKAITDQEVTAQFLDEGMKLHRWLGFVQGVLWANGIYTLDELRAQTKKALDA